MSAHSISFAAIGRLLAISAGVVVFAGTATADPLSGVTVDFTNNQGTLSGFFQLDLATKAITDWDLSVTAFNCASQVTCESSGFPQLEYTPQNSASSIGFTFGAQSIFFIDSNVFGASSVLSFVMNCGGNSNDCLGIATDGSSIPLFSAGESRSIVPIGRSLSLASLSITDPEGVLSFNVVSGGGGTTNPVPEPATALLLAPVLGGLILRRRQRGKASV